MYTVYMHVYTTSCFLKMFHKLLFRLTIVESDFVQEVKIIYIASACNYICETALLSTFYTPHHLPLYSHIWLIEV